ITNQCIQSCGSEGSVGVLFGRGDGTFETANTYLTGGTYQQSVAVADVNGDGRPDVLVANYSCLGRHCNGDGGVAVLLANRDGTFQKLQLYDSGAYGADSMLVADLNGDGRADVVVTDYCQNCQSSVMGVLLNGSIARTTMTVTSSANPSQLNQPVTLTATIISKKSS